MDDFSTIVKYKGLVNDELQIRAYFSHDAQHIICGSENQHVYIWNTLLDPPNSLLGGKVKRQSNQKNDSYDYFRVNLNTVTNAQFVPRSTIAICTPDGEHLSNITHVVLACGYGGELKFYENRRVANHAVDKDAK